MERTIIIPKEKMMDIEEADAYLAKEKADLIGEIDTKGLEIAGAWSISDAFGNLHFTYKLRKKSVGMNVPESSPVKSDSPSIWDLVIKDMAERDSFGTTKYGTHLQGFNGRDALRDAYQEALDLVVYLRQAIYERDSASKKP